MSSTRRPSGATRRCSRSSSSTTRRARPTTRSPTTARPCSAEKIVLERADVSCLRCHRVNGEGGNAGPDLAGVGARHPREYLLESILYPNKQIAQGWETVIVRLKNGDVVSGVLRQETDQELRLELVDPNNPSAKPKPLVIEKKNIDKRRGGQSAMPEGMAKSLKKQDLRNLVEFLATLKDPPADAAGK
jgi:quinoprotein glucose dehydrogenase